MSNSLISSIYPDFLSPKSNDWSEPFFTGWKEEWENYDTVQARRTGGYVGQIICKISRDFIDHETRYAYINLPGKELGMFVDGGVMDIGTERIVKPLTDDQATDMLRDGLGMLREYISKIESGDI